MRAMVEVIAKALVDDPESVEVHEVEEAGDSILELSVAQPDLGKVIGKQGRTVRAMRTLLVATGAKASKRFVLEILE
ncbi:MAG: KH domain-containing protein [Acidobacteria bacterium]|nr:KH domain-containing protein [Acidobacteriota bacterium]